MKKTVQELLTSVAQQLSAYAEMMELCANMTPTLSPKACQENQLKCVRYIKTALTDLNKVIALVQEQKGGEE